MNEYLTTIIIDKEKFDQMVDLFPYNGAYEDVKGSMLRLTAIDTHTQVRYTDAYESDGLFVLGKYFFVRSMRGDEVVYQIILPVSVLDDVQIRRWLVSTRTSWKQQEPWLIEKEFPLFLWGWILGAGEQPVESFLFPKGYVLHWLDCRRSDGAIGIQGITDAVGELCLTPLYGGSQSAANELFYNCLTAA